MSGEPEWLKSLINSDEHVRNALNKVKELQSDPRSIINKSISTDKHVKITRKLIVSTYAKYSLVVNNRNVNRKNIKVFIAYAMELSNEILKKSPNVYKTELALILIRQHINNEIKDETLRNELHDIVEVVVVSFIKHIFTKKTSIIKKLLSCLTSKSSK